jgi:hypothetical protein
VGTPQTDLALDFVAINQHLTAGGTRDAALQRLVDLAVGAVPGCQWAAVTSWPLGRRPESVASSGEVATAADDLQYALRDGPCLDAAADAVAVHSPDLASDDRWPRFAAAVRERTPVRGVVSFDLAGEPARHALNLYSGRAGALAEGDLGTAALFAAHARVLLAHATSAGRADDLRQALSTSRRIGEAVGILMHLHRTTSDEAFQLLVRSSQHLNRKLRDIAEDVTETGTLPDRPPG